MSWFSDLFQKYVAFTAIKIGELGGLDKLQPLQACTISKKCAQIIQT